MGDECQICDGQRGGVPGNENIVSGQTMCDYCHSDYMAEDEHYPNKRTKAGKYMCAVCTAPDPKILSLHGCLVCSTACGLHLTQVFLHASVIRMAGRK